MTDQSLLEDRLRRTFEAVADRAVASAGATTAPPRSLPPPSASPQASSSMWHRGRGLLVGAVVVVVVAAAFAFALAYGPRSSTPSPVRTPTASQPPPGRASLRLVYRPATPVSLKERRQIASIMDARLRSLRSRDIKVSVAGSDIDVSARVSGGDVRRDMNLVGDAAVVTFRPVDCLAPPFFPTPNPDRPPRLECGPTHLINGDSTKVGDLPSDSALDSYSSTTPAQADHDNAGTVLLPTDPTSLLDGKRVVLGPTELSGAAIAGAAGQGINGRWSVNLDLTRSGATMLDEVEHENFHRLIGVVLDGAVVAVTPIEPHQAVFTSANGRFNFGGNFSPGQAIDLTVLLNHGSFPVPVKLISSTTFGAGLHPGSN
jgi:hypothetical protein